MVGGTVKQWTRELIRIVYGPKSEQYRLMALLVYMAVKADLKQIDVIVIDKDYWGKQAESTLKSFSCSSRASIVHVLRLA